MTKQSLLVKSTNNRKSSFNDSLQTLKIPIKSAAVYKPLVLGLILLVLQSLGGDAYISKFTIQILNSSENSKLSTLNISMESNNSLPASVLSNTTNLYSSFKSKTEDSSTFIFPLVIQIVKLVVIFLMTFLIRKLRVRFLYFLSLICTVIILAFLDNIKESVRRSYNFHHWR